jgi:peptidoglycan hydrolase-like protein with peptidoglycan-binding domain
MNYRSDGTNMAFGDKDIQQRNKGADVVELQLKLNGLRGTLRDGDFGPVSELQVMAFQREVMGMNSPSGVFDASSFDALNQFEANYPIDFASIRCPCG